MPYALSATRRAMSSPTRYLSARTTLLLLVMLLGTVPSTAQAVDNDDFDDAILIPNVAHGYYDERDASDATSSPNDPDCYGREATVWYRFSPTDDVRIAIDLYPNYATTLSVYTGTSSDLTQLVCTTSTYSKVEVSAGQTYFIMVGALDGAPGNWLGISISVIAPLAHNDDMADAMSIPDVPYYDEQDTSDATAGANDPDCFGNQSTVWYSFTPSHDMRISVQASDSDYATTLSAYTGTPEHFKRHGCIYANWNTYWPRLVLDVSAGETYLFMVGAYRGSSGGVLRFSVNTVPLNDTIDRATVIGTSPFTEQLGAYYATSSTDDPDCYGHEATVWYAYTPTVDMRITADTFGSDGDTTLSVYTGVPSNLTQLACIYDEPFWNTQSRIVMDVGANETYYFMIGSYDSFSYGEITFSIRQLMPPSNDDIDAATTITGLPFTDQLDTSDAMAAVDDPTCAGTGATVWYRFTPTANALIVADTVGSDYSTTVAAYTGAPGNLTQVACSHETGLFMGKIAFDVIAGQTYSIVVGGAPDSRLGGQLAFSVRAHTSGPLQTAINVAASGATLQLPPGTYTEDLLITKDIQLEGAGPEETILQGTGTGPVVTVAPDATASISGVTIRGGNASYGGGVYSEGTLTLTDVTVRDNGASDGGGGISSGWEYQGGALLLVDSTVTNNIGDGIAIFGGTAVVTDTAVSRNTGAGINNGGTYLGAGQLSTIRSGVMDNGGAGIVSTESTFSIEETTVRDNAGAGIILEYASGEIADTTISGNAGVGIDSGASYWRMVSSTVSDNGDDGIVNLYAGIELVNATVSGNAGNGIVVAEVENRAWAELFNSTITANLGGGITNWDGSVDLTNTIVVGNQSSDGSGSDCRGGYISSHGHNLIGDPTCELYDGEAEVPGPAPTDLIDVDPLLGPLADNGGPTLTHALYAGSPAIDAGNPSPVGSGDVACPTTDQRDVTRPLDGDGDGEARCDIGAVEQDTMIPPGSITLDFETLSPGQVVDDLLLDGHVVPVTGANRRLPDQNTALIFDATCQGDPSQCGGGDDDLYFPEQGNVLIVAENLVDADGDGFVDDPDDANLRNVLTFDFRALGTVTIESLVAMDLGDKSREQLTVNGVSAGGRIELYAGGPTGQRVTTVAIPRMGDHEQMTVPINVSGIDFMRITLAGSGALDDLRLQLAS